MNKKLLIVFLILTIIPVSLLGWLGFVSSRMEKDRALERAFELAAGKLENINLQIRNTISGIENELLGLPGISDLSVDEIRGFTRKNRFIRQVFILSEDGTLRYPADSIPLSGQERDFLARVKEIGISPGLFLINPEEGETGSPGFGWYTWYLGEGVNFIFWKMEGEEIIGFELNRSAVISAVIRGLPDTPLEKGSSFLAVLKDGLGRTVYQWGSYKPREEETAAAVITPEDPLEAWHIHYFLSPRTVADSGTGPLPLYLSIAAAVLGIIGLSVFLYRESTREVRDAYQKVSFVNQVSHELKTPLTNIRMYAELLENRLPAEDEKAADYLGIVTAESRRLSRLIANVLTFAKEKKSGISFNPAEISVDDVVQTVLNNFRPVLQEKGIIAELDLNCGEPVFADRDIIDQIIGNLISNVEKYASSGKYLKIHTMQEGNTAVVTVQDKGPGIPRGSKEKVFQPFYRLSNKLTDGVSGTGIGLSIVRTLAGIHGGSAKILPSEQGTLIKIIFRAEKGRNHENTGS